MTEFRFEGRKRRGGIEEQPFSDAAASFAAAQAAALARSRRSQQSVIKKICPLQHNGGSNKLHDRNVEQNK